MLEKIKNYYSPNIEQKIDRLEQSFFNLVYNNQDSVEWVASVKNQITKLIVKNTVFSDKTIKSVILRALKNELIYKTRINIIKHIEPNITINNL